MSLSTASTAKKTVNDLNNEKISPKATVTQ